MHVQRVKWGSLLHFGLCNYKTEKYTIQEVKANLKTDFLKSMPVISTPLLIRKIKAC